MLFTTYILTLVPGILSITKKKILVFIYIDMRYIMVDPVFFAFEYHSNAILHPIVLFSKA